MEASRWLTASVEEFLAEFVEVNSGEESVEIMVSYGSRGRDWELISSKLRFGTRSFGTRSRLPQFSRSKFID